MIDPKNNPFQLSLARGTLKSLCGERPRSLIWARGKQMGFTPGAAAPQLPLAATRTDQFVFSHIFSSRSYFTSSE